MLCKRVQIPRWLEASRISACAIILSLSCTSNESAIHQRDRDSVQDNDDTTSDTSSDSGDGDVAARPDAWTPIASFPGVARRNALTFTIGSQV